jgi:uncharacterized membrane protein
MEEHMTDYGGDNDKRILKRKIANGEISEEALERYLSELPDVSACAEEMIIE